MKDRKSFRHQTCFVGETYISRGSSPSSRPRTPPSVSRTRSTRSPPSQTRPIPLSISANGPLGGPTRSRTWGVGDYNADNDELEDLDDEQDEFGLPSIARQRKALPDRSTQFSPDSETEAQARIDRDMAMLGIIKPGRRRANSSDISEVRDGAAVYPTMKLNDEKILRPQYKDILKGKSCAHIKTLC